MSEAPIIDAQADVLQNVVPFDGLLAMEQQDWNYLVLLDDDGKLHGVISDTDLACSLLASPSALGHRIKGYVFGSTSINLFSKRLLLTWQNARRSTFPRS